MKQARLAAKSKTAQVAEVRDRRAMGRGLRIGDPNNVFEQEAARVADDVTAVGISRFPWSFSKMGSAAPLQHKCACGGPGECEACKQKNAILQRSASDPAALSEAPPIGIALLENSGDASSLAHELGHILFNLPELSQGLIYPRPAAPAARVLQLIDPQWTTIYNNA